MKESEYQKKIMDELEKNEWITLKSMTNNKNGFPDVQAFKKSVCVFIEVKTNKGRVMPLQEFRHRQLRAAGFDVIVANGDRWREDIQHLLQPTKTA